MFRSVIKLLQTNADFIDGITLMYKKEEKIGRIITNSSFFYISFSFFASSHSSSFLFFCALNLLLFPSFFYFSFLLLCFRLQFLLRFFFCAFLLLFCFVLFLFLYASSFSMSSSVFSVLSFSSSSFPSPVPFFNLFVFISLYILAYSTSPHLFLLGVFFFSFWCSCLFLCFPLFRFLLSPC